VQQACHYEHYTNVDEAIAREKQIKRWSRSKKVELVERLNPSWLDLGTDILAED
jgi:putative endonuclease